MLNFGDQTRTGVPNVVWPRPLAHTPATHLIAPRSHTPQQHSLASTSAHSHTLALASAYHACDPIGRGRNAVDRMQRTEVCTTYGLLVFKLPTCVRGSIE